jgi:SAM-dependent methyltransferase
MDRRSYAGGVAGRDLFDIPYDPSWGYDERFFHDVEHRYTKMHRLLRERWGDPAGKRVVDLGSSRGLLLARFPESDRAGIEIDPEERARGAEHGVEAVEHFINAFDGNRLTARLPFEDASADVVLAGEIIEHIVDTESFLREVARVLRPSGAVVLSTPNILWWKHRLALVAGRYPDALDFRTRYGDDFGHVRIFTPGLMRDLLEETGFVDVTIVGKRLGPISSLVRPPRPVAHGLDRLADRLPKLSDHLIAYARRP